jgi:hypothetical protein
MRDVASMDAAAVLTCAKALKHELSLKELPTEVTMNVISLEQLKANLKTEDDKRLALVNQGRAAYRLGIEEYNCPMKALSEKKLWAEGYRLEREKFSELLRRNGGNMR